MKPLKTLALLTAGFAYALIVFGAVVRITDSGLGCGPNWPKCNGHLVPAFTDYHVAIEYAHRMAALGLLVLIVSLLAMTLSRRSLPGVSGRGGVLRPVVLAFVLYFAQAILGAITVWLDLRASAIVLHLGTAMGLLATLLVAGWRAGRTGGTGGTGGTGQARLKRAAIAALVMSAAALLLGGLTATTGASLACQGFPLCNGRLWPEAGNGLAQLQWIHRLVAYALFGHLIGVAMGARRRGASPMVRSWAWIAFACVALQVIVAAAMIGLHLPPVWRAMHVAVGTAVWVAVVGLAWRVLANRGSEASTVI